MKLRQIPFPKLKFTRLGLIFIVAVLAVFATISNLSLISKKSVIDIIEEISKDKRTTSIEYQWQDVANNGISENVNLGIETNADFLLVTSKIIDEQIQNAENEIYPESLLETHPLENKCKYGILQTFDANLLDYVKRPENGSCKQVLPNIISFENNTLSFDQESAIKIFNYTVTCQYRPIGGTLWPMKNSVKGIGPWVNLTGTSSKIFEDQIEVQCFKDNENKPKIDYKYSFAQIPPKLDQSFTDNTEDLLSIDIIVLDSTSRNAFRRHMPLTYEYLKENLHAIDLQGFMKVADNTIPNLMPILTGLRYLNVSEDMLSDIPLGKQLDTDKIPFLWNEYRDKGCVTMLNDDPVYVGYGLFQYPGPEFNGLYSKPTDYYFRPWHIYNRQNPVSNQSRFCFGNGFYFDYQLSLHEQMSMLYKSKCHFSFTMITELSHDDCNNLELIDSKLKDLVKRLKDTNSLNKTVLIVMGDHGQRINNIRYRFIARIEERMPLLTVVFPEWFLKKHPQLIRNFRLNENRLTSHFDIYQTLKDISDGNFDGKTVNTKFPRQERGLSLLHNEISRERTCNEANVPENLCACLIPDKEVLQNETVKAVELIKNYTNEKLENFPQCKIVEEIRLINITRWTLSQMIQHGVKEMTNAEQMSALKRKIVPSVEYFEVEYEMAPINITALIRLQSDKKNKLFFVNSDPPLILTGKFGCKDEPLLPHFCICD